MDLEHGVEEDDEVSAGQWDHVVDLDLYSVQAPLEAGDIDLGHGIVWGYGDQTPAQPFSIDARLAHVDAMSQATVLDVRCGEFLLVSLAMDHFALESVHMNPLIFLSS